ncbi:uncharacterized protein L3040_001693 [Drepanopeziza brunnea f. sp. 'multigermtubi']|uniref:uncharacterized protein n=1 Tax=Drepanopeziza brunnea f. sp. 'multigermtubi' TaxID=698441 RepID=UPI00239C09D2|nr:hypothetical protein L3040_001693 [Drepanopeziza brunnea f. sp. 'multigermtubi']
MSPIRDSQTPSARKNKKSMIKAIIQKLKPRGRSSPEPTPGEESAAAAAAPPPPPPPTNNNGPLPNEREVPQFLDLFAPSGATGFSINGLAPGSDARSPYDIVNAMALHTTMEEFLASQST